MLNEEQQDDLLRLVKEATEQLKIANEQRDEAVAANTANTELLNHATEDIQVLLAFIKSHNLQPPKTHQA